MAEHRPHPAPRHARRRAWLGLCLGGLLGGCFGNHVDAGLLGGQDPAGTPGGNGATDGTTTPPGGIPFAPVPIETGLRKVKTLLTGQAPTDAERQAAQKGGAALRPLVSGWMKTDAYRAVMLDFFASQFQQSQMRREDFPFIMYDGMSPDDAMFAGMAASFPRTVMQLIDEGRPFTETMTTTRFMMTTSLMVYYAYTDMSRVGDERGLRTTWYASDNNGPVFQYKAGPVSLADAANPAGPHWLTFYAPNLNKNYIDQDYSPNKPSDGNQTCASVDPLVWIPYRAFGLSNSWADGVWNYLNGNGLRFLWPIYGPDELMCLYPGTGTSLFKDQDANDWRMVQVRAPGPGERHREFFDLDTIRNSNLLLMDGARVGFFTTPAFLSQWGTNPSNSSRAALNQTLIAALGAQVDGNDTLPLSVPSAVDPNHAKDPACYACHQTLDPMRQFFRQSYGLRYSPQDEPTQKALPAQFSFLGHRADGTGVTALAQALAQHPKFAEAWTLKLCAWANSAPCVAADPEVQRIAAAFAASNFDFNVLALETFTSPLVTYASPTLTAVRQGQVASIARRSQLCHTIEQRLGIPDVCALATAQPDGGNSPPSRAAALPQDGYTRGVSDAMLVTAPDPFYLSNVENLCALVAATAIDGDAKWASSQDPNATLDAVVAQLMGIGPDARADFAAVMRGHYDDARAQGSNAQVALRSVFVAACTSAAVSGVGL